MLLADYQPAWEREKRQCPQSHVFHSLQRRL